MKRKIIAFGLTVGLLIGVLATAIMPLYAGEGDGSGGGKKQPLALVGSVPADGAAGVNTDASIKLTFSKNVVYMTVRDNNKKCFSLWTDNQQVPIEVIMADDQIEFEKRNDVILKPLQTLKAATTYRVEIAPQLESKSGVNLGQKTTVSFTTAGVIKETEQLVKEKPATDTGKVVKEPEMPATGEDKTISKNIKEVQPAVEQKVAEKNDEKIVKEPTAAVKEKAQETEKKDGKIVLVISGVIIALLAAGWIYRKSAGK